MRETDEVIVERFLADLHALYPQTRGVDRRTRRCGAGSSATSTRSPGRGRLQPALEGALGAHENLHLAGDYFAELGTWRPPPAPGSRPPNASTPDIREVHPCLSFHGVLPALITPFTEDGERDRHRRARARSSSA